VSELPYIVVGGPEKVLGKEVVVFDLDGVLIDSSERYRLALAEVDSNAKSHVDLPKDKRNQFWRVFLSEKYMHLDKPVPEAIEMLNKRRERFPIVIITGRTDNMLSKTLDQLRRFGIEFDVLVMRRVGVYQKDYEFKERVVKELGLSIAELHDDSTDIIDVLHKYTSRGSFYWYKPGKYIYVPPVKMVIGGRIHIVENSEEMLREAVDIVERSQGSEVEIRYGDYRVSLPKRYAKAFIEAFHARLAKELCYEGCYYVVEGVPFFEHIQLAAEDAERGEARKTRIFGEVHPSCTGMDFDKVFGDPKRIAKAWLELKESGLLSEELG